MKGTSTKWKQVVSCHPDNPDHPAKPDTSPWSPEQGDFVVPERQSPAFIITNQSAKPEVRQREFVVT
jgi:hypothetical protein